MCKNQVELQWGYNWRFEVSRLQQMLEGWLVLWAMRLSVHDLLLNSRVWTREAQVYAGGLCLYQSERIRIVIVGNPWMSGSGISCRKSQHIHITRVLNRLNDSRGPANRYAISIYWKTLDTWNGTTQVSSSTLCFRILSCLHIDRGKYVEHSKSHTTTLSDNIVEIITPIC